MAYLLQELLRDSARRRPAAVAVDAADRSLTYTELERLSDQLARVLRSRGVPRGDRVGILAPKAAASVIAVFAALKCGACYVPLDPASPDERLKLIIADSGMRAVLADEAHTDRALALTAAAPQDCDVISVNEEATSGSVDTLPATGAADTDLAYILYTSGSTGVPKGVMISHRASLTFVDWAASCAELEERDRVCSPAPLHFDLSVFDIFASCRAGATMVLLPPRTSMFPVRLAEWIQEQRISVWYSVPSILTLLATHGKLSTFDLSRLRALIFAGEVFPAKHLSMLIGQLPDARFLNWYGPTETNVCTWYELPHGTSSLTAPVPIGRACANVDAFAVTDDGHRVSTTGQQGELFVSGPGLMSGYWGQHEKTRAALVANPLADARASGLVGAPARPLANAPAELVYRTGDMVGLDGEGNFVFLGRRDGMVKTRGYRVELGEVESVLYEHPAVSEAAVLPVRDELLGNRLRAVICAERQPSRQDLLDHCRRRLPAYMVPDTVEFSDTLPKTSTGKVDRVLLGSR